MRMHMLMNTLGILVYHLYKLTLKISYAIFFQ